MYIQGTFEIIIDLPLGFPINNIISLSLCGVCMRTCACVRVKSVCEGTYSPISYNMWKNMIHMSCVIKMK